MDIIGAREDGLLVYDWSCAACGVALTSVTLAELPGTKCKRSACPGEHFICRNPGCPLCGEPGKTGLCVRLRNALESVRR